MRAEAGWGLVSLPLWKTAPFDGPKTMVSSSTMVGFLGNQYHIIIISYIHEGLMIGNNNIKYPHMDNMIISNIKRGD